MKWSKVTNSCPFCKARFKRVEKQQVSGPVEDIGKRFHKIKPKDQKYEYSPPRPEDFDSDDEGLFDGDVIEVVDLDGGDAWMLDLNDSSDVSLIDVLCDSLYDYDVFDFGAVDEDDNGGDVTVISTVLPQRPRQTLTERLRQHQLHPRLFTAEPTEEKDKESEVKSKSDDEEKDKEEGEGEGEGESEKKGRRKQGGDQGELPSKRKRKR
eukprot:TRINITY_DN3675_c0_g1_i1.p2 TRINITY_DN3675_c0_g1~~TRINITY_DN3675_c0_g1_i1.p2  ORF type:complete len:209 (+),score=68.92 TRINITY_DN3675_c0_g1_i1:535-1161(+)